MGRNHWRASVLAVLIGLITNVNVGIDVAAAHSPVISD